MENILKDKSYMDISGDELNLHKSDKKSIIIKYHNKIS